MVQSIKNRPSVKNYVSNVSDKYGRVIYFSAKNDDELSDVINAISELPIFLYIRRRQSSK